MPSQFYRGSVAAAALASAMVLTETALPHAARPVDPVVPPPPPTLLATVHPPVGREASTLWLAPTQAERSAALSNISYSALVVGLKFYEQQKYEQALSRFIAASTAKSPLHDYAAYYAGVAELRLQRYEPARRRFVDLENVQGYISQAASLGEAEAARGLGDHATESKIYERLLTGKPVDEPSIWLNLATSTLASNERARAAEAYLHLYYEFPTHELAEQAVTPLGTMPEVVPIQTGNMRYKLELGRGERMFGLRRIADARTSLLRVKPFAKDDDEELVALRLAECDYFQARYLAARDALRPYLSKGARQAEARFFYLMSQRGLKDNNSFELLARALMKDFPDSTWTEDTLNNLVTYYIQEKSDEEIDAIVREQYARYPKGRYSERAAWKAGWHAYRTGNMTDAIQFFESAAASFPRSDYRPAYLYWSGRAHEAMGDRAGAIQRLQLVTVDYLNTYYGRLAVPLVAKLGSTPARGNLVFLSSAQVSGEDDNFPATSTTIRALLALGLWEPAIKELEFARNVDGDSPVIAATIAWVNRQQAASQKGIEQFNLARGAINIMKRAYPQFLASGGEQLPRELLTIIYPLSYWDLIRKYSAMHDLDPYLMAALMSQESTFVADIRSSANAYGLTQLLPVTAREYARKLNLKYSSRMLTNPEANIQIGMAYFADTVRRFGAVHLALASYNAGPTAVRRWMNERPDLPREIFIDDIPYPETQNYVKKILSTAEDYRRLYAAN